MAAKMSEQESKPLTEIGRDKEEEEEEEEEDSSGVSIEKFVPQYLDELNWKPKCSNFEIIDWEKWDGLNPSIPKVYDPPQLKIFGEWYCIPVWWNHRPSFLFRGCCIRPFIRYWFEGEALISRLTDNDIFEQMLDPSRESDNVPDYLRGVWWMRDNIAPETIATFQNWAWKSKKKGGVQALGKAQYNWSTDDSCMGVIWKQNASVVMGLLQIHPKGTWMSLATFRDAGPDGEVKYMWFYRVQPGDEFLTKDGKKIDYINPGDFVRISFGDFQGRDPYECNHDKLWVIYHLVRVAYRDDDDHGNLVRVQPNFDHLRQKASQQYEKQPACCGGCSYNMTAEERAQMQVDELSNQQVWTPSPPPPPAHMIDRF